MKANPMPAVVQHLAGLTDGLDVASAGELAVALATGTDPRNISFAGPGKSDADLAAAVASGVIINMESEGEMARIAALAARYRQPPPGGDPGQPGLRAEDLRHEDGRRPQALRRRCRAGAGHAGASWATLPLEFMGFHIFSGSQNLRPEAIIEAQTKTFELAFRLAEAAPSPVRWLNIGGGLGIPYFPGEQRIELAAIAANLAAPAGRRPATGCRTPKS